MMVFVIYIHYMCVCVCVCLSLCINRLFSSPYVGLNENEFSIAKNTIDSLTAVAFIRIIYIWKKSNPISLICSPSTSQYRRLYATLIYIMYYSRDCPRCVWTIGFIIYYKISWCRRTNEDCGSSIFSSASS